LKSWQLTSLALVGLLVQSLGSNLFIREHSTSLAIDLALITALTLSLMGTAALITRTVDGVLKKRTKKKLEERGLGELGDAFTGASGSSVMRNSFLYVVILAVSAGLVDGVLLGNLTSYYEVEGRYNTIVRAGDSDAIGLMLEEMATETLGQRLEIYVNDFMVPLLEREDVREEALLSLWVTGERMGRSVDLITFTGATSGGWEKALLKSLGQKPAEAVRAYAGADAPPGVQKAALSALGTFRTGNDLERLGEGLKSDSGEVRVGAIIGLSAYKGSLDAVELVLEALEKGLLDGKAQELAAYTIGDIMMVWQPSRVGGESNERATSLMARYGTFLEGEGLDLQCVGVTALRKARIPSCAQSLFRIFEGSKKGAECTAISMERAPLSPVTLAVAGAVQFRVLDALSLMALGNDEILDWVVERRAGEGAHDYEKAVQDGLKSLELKLTPKGE
jgi:hypothetical protein